MSAYAKFNGFLNVGYVLNGLKWVLIFRCRCHLVEIPYQAFKRKSVSAMNVAILSAKR